MSTLKVDGIRSNSASSDAITLASDGTCTANITNNLSNRNLIINGAMQVAQRGTSGTTTSSGYLACDRMRISVGGVDEAVTMAQSALTSSDTPYTKGFRYATKITNGNQTSGAGATDKVNFMYRLEGLDVNGSGWDYTSASSFVTISFWVKSSVAQTFYLRFRMTGSSVTKEYVTAINATTSWQKITKTIPGGTGVDSVNTTAEGAFVQFVLFRGTGETGSMTIDQWNTYNSSAKVPDMTSTWYTTNDATFEITGLQMEVGSVATDFEHRSFGQELALCQRYFYKTYDYATAPGTATFVGAQHGRNFDPGAARSSVPIYLNFPVRMRTVPTLTWYAGDGQSGKYSTGSTVGGSNLTTEKSVGTSIDKSETGIYHANFTEDVPAANLYAYHVLAEAEL